MQAGDRPMNLRRMAFAAWALLAVLQVAWHGLLLPPTRMPVVIALGFSLLPLALPLLAMRRPQRALFWAGLVSLLYFSHGVMEAWSAPAERGPALVEIALSVLLIAALGIDARRNRRRADV
ncbi:MAG: DUF2069 domain-containing protein [Xanthomonadaceae bacterium]|nr:DUF2069 domain-containing protein [Xanthomonadaceae bacterium]MDE2178490.1 DUF2069 domain-containing protein [Xanthomonadaceae bacterium]MDE2245269.1 DUF2069 domain-containing protein [Xanthomonadaceae bacterium]